MMYDTDAGSLIVDCDGPDCNGTHASLKTRFQFVAQLCAAGWRFRGNDGEDKKSPPAVYWWCPTCAVPEKAIRGEVAK